MPHYMLSVHSVEGQAREPMTEEEMRRSHQLLSTVEEEMKESGMWVFSGRLHEADTATVVRTAGRQTVTTDGPFTESKDHLGGFYVIRADDLDAALALAAKVTAAIDTPIEVRPFAATSEE
ncbi:YCII-related domain-containing protein [Nonomuraea polychroma]|uniref:YCII-related domain-containing protein n=1 Tax=Nonomuraea polychroma TaxID=46176 RepID=A0A438MEF5_9ACTN|nr:YciI family protein [Nonomuraea polychroma]RVX43925.1 YCII-related domain-containing protein [Nonomuraea polychroma]